MTNNNYISNSQIARFNNLINRSSLSFEEREELLSKLTTLKQYDASDLSLYLEMNQLDITQLSHYTKDDINKRLDYIDLHEAM